jgi:hypothetical protein
MPRVPAHMRRPVVEGRPFIDVRAWARQGLLLPNQSFCCEWARRGVPAGSVEVLPKPEAVVLLFHWRASDAEAWKPCSQRVLLASTVCHFGSERRWLLCPRQTQDGQLCNRRVAKLYLHGRDGFVCRRCCMLVYSSQRESAGDRAIRKVQKLRQRLGGSASVIDPLPPRPRYMHMRVYDRLLRRALAASARWAALESARLRLSQRPSVGLDPPWRPAAPGRPLLSLRPPDPVKRRSHARRLTYLRRKLAARGCGQR